MDKNMINIDELFRQKLGGAVEGGQPGSWLKMKELLDKEMPVQTPGNSVNWRRMFGLVAGMLVVVSASIGGYNAMTSFRNADGGSATSGEVATGITANRQESVANSNNSNQQVAANTQKPVQTVTNSNNSGNTQVAANTQKPAQTVTNSNNSGNTQVAANSQKPAQNVTTERSELVSANKKTSTNETNSNNHPSATAKNTPAKPEQNGTSSVAKVSENVTNSNKATAQQEASAKASETVKNNGNKLVGNNLNKNTATVALNDKQPKQASAKAAASVAVNDKLSSGNNTPSNKPVVANKPAVNNTAVGTTPAAQTEVAKAGNTSKKELDKVQMKESYDRKTGAWKQDTIDKGKMEWSTKEEPVLAMKPKEANAANTEVVPASASTATAAENKEQLVPLSDFRTSSKKQNYETTNAFEEMVKNAKMALGNVRFYPGLVAGVNYSYSKSNPMGGFQGGLTGTLSLNEKWGIVSELKFTQRFKDGSKESQSGTYMTPPVHDVSSGTYTWNVVDYYFTYPSMSSIDMPVMLRHSYNRFNYMLGANLTYYFGFSPGQTSKPPQEVSQTSLDGYNPAPDGYILTPADFASRFGIGYAGGVGYQISPAWGADLRLTQTLWTNSSAYGEKQVSKEVFQLPSLQFNFSYRFSSNKYKPYREH